MASTEVVGKFKYTKDDGTVTSGSKTFTDCTAELTKEQAATAVKKYSAAVAGNLTAGQFKTVEDLDVD